MRWSRTLLTVFLTIYTSAGLQGLSHAVESAKTRPAYLQEKPTKRIALVIANWSYDEGSLDSAKKDMSAIVTELERFGFTVKRAENFRSREELVNETLMPFLNTVSFGDFVVVYYSGHGMSTGSENYLVPIKYPKEISEQEFLRHFVSAEEIQRKLVEYQAGITLVFLDACRTFTKPKILKPDRTELEARKGLSPGTRVSTNAAIAYAAEPGSESIGYQGDRLSIFTEALVDVMAAEIDEYDTLKREVNIRVLQISRDRQAPWFHESTTAVVRLRDNPDSIKAARQAWLNVLGRGTNDAVTTYLRMFPTSPFAFAAREWLRDNAYSAPIATAQLPAAVASEVWNQSADRALASVSSGSEPDVDIRAWTGKEMGMGERFPLPEVGKHIKHARSATENHQIQGAASVAISPPTGTLENRNARVGALMAANSTVVVAKPTAVYDAPSASANRITVLPKDSVVKIEGTQTDPRGNVWVEGRAKSIDRPVFFHPQPSDSVQTSGVSVGKPLAEGLLLADPNSDGALVDTAKLYRLLAVAKDTGKNISWAAIEAPRVMCNKSDSRCVKKNDSITLQTLHIEGILAEAGLKRERITTLFEAKDAPEGKLRVRLFTGGEDVVEK